MLGQAPHTAVVCAGSSSIAAVPEGLSELRKLSVRECQNLAREWLPASSATRAQALLYARGAAGRQPLPGQVLALVHAHFAQLAQSLRHGGDVDVARSELSQAGSAACW